MEITAYLLPFLFLDLFKLFFFLGYRVSIGMGTRLVDEDCLDFFLRGKINLWPLLVRAFIHLIGRQFFRAKFTCFYLYFCSVKIHVCKGHII